MKWPSFAVCNFMPCSCNTVILIMFSKYKNFEHIQGLENAKPKFYH